MIIHDSNNDDHDSDNDDPRPRHFKWSSHSRPASGWMHDVLRENLHGSIANNDFDCRNNCLNS